jgi:hypothetical protein
LVPLDRVIMPRSLACAPPDAVGVPLAVTGGQIAAHAPEQADEFLPSFMNRYTVRPDPVVRNVPADPVWVSITVAVADEEPAGEALAGAPPPYPLPVLVLVPVPLLVLLHAAAASSATASGAPSLTVAGNRRTHEVLIVIVSRLGRR